MTDFERKIEPGLTDHGLGFPVVWRDVPMIRVFDEWVADVDFTTSPYVNAVLVALAVRGARLTGAHIRFVRQSWGLTFEKFGNRFAVTKQAVMKWEKAGKNLTQMEWGTEKDIRLSMLRRVGIDATKFVEAYEEFTRVPQGADASTPLEICTMIDASPKKAGQSRAPTCTSPQ